MSSACAEPLQTKSSFESWHNSQVSQQDINTLELGPVTGFAGNTFYDECETECIEHTRQLK